jgi:thiamine biosynthesis lipoprotein
VAAGIGVRRVEHLMGTVFTITVLDESHSDSAVDKAFAWLREVEATFSTFREDSEISRIGRGDLTPDHASTEVRHVLARCAEIESATEGRFSIRPGRAGGPGLDPAGFVKGWSVDEAAMLLLVEGVDRFFINAGGDVKCVGAPPDHDRWRIGVRHPQSPNDTGAVLRIREGAVATSGTYFRGEHIWGKHQSEDEVTSVTVTGPDLGLADALATAIYGDQAASLTWMGRFPGYGVALMTSDHRISWTEPLDGVVVESPGNAVTDV